MNINKSFKRLKTIILSGLLGSVLLGNSPLNALEYCLNKTGIDFTNCVARNTFLIKDNAELIGALAKLSLSIDPIIKTTNRLIKLIIDASNRLVPLANSLVQDAMAAGTIIQDVQSEIEKGNIDAQIPKIVNLLTLLTKFTPFIEELEKIIATLPPLTDPLIDFFWDIGRLFPEFSFLQTATTNLRTLINQANQRYLPIAKNVDQQIQLVVPRLNDAITAMLQLLALLKQGA